MPQTLSATAACEPVCELNGGCTPPLQKSVGNPAVGEVTQSSGGIRVETAGVETAAKAAQSPAADPGTLIRSHDPINLAFTLKDGERQTGLRSDSGRQIKAD